MVSANLVVFLQYLYTRHYNYNITQEEKTKIEERIVDVLRTVYDPEIPVNIYDLGLIYKVDVKDDGDVDLDMTFTAPSCPAAEFMLEDVRQKVEGLEGYPTYKLIDRNGRIMPGRCPRPSQPDMVKTAIEQLQE